MRSRGFCFLLLFIGSLWLFGQDPIPTKSKNAAPMQYIEAPLDKNALLVNPIEIPNSLPFFFHHCMENTIQDENRTLYPLFEKVKKRREPVRIVHIGDSHVRGHIMTRRVRYNFERDFGDEAVYKDSISYFTSGLARETGNPGIVYHALGINGATTSKFATEEQMYEIAQLQPDLIIISFGTNESHSRNYTAGKHWGEMNILITMLQRFNPQATYLITTPPGSYVRSRKNRIINTRTPIVAESICRYAQQKGIAYWDLYHIAGGEKRACQNWLDGKYYQRDRIHFTESGYELHGNLLYEALIKAYNEYVVN